MTCRGLSWKQRLWLEESIVGFDNDILQQEGWLHDLTHPPLPVCKSATLATCSLACQVALTFLWSTAGFTSLTNPAGSVSTVFLQSMGPKLLVSDLTTFDQPVLRWRFRVKGNMAVEFGVVPSSLMVSLVL